MTTSTLYAAASWKALGSDVHLLVHPLTAGQAAATRAAQILAEVERSCSRFRADSDLSRVNRHAGEWVEISPTLHQALTVALTAARTTGGIVDPTLGLVLAGLGYDRDFLQIRTPGAAGHRPAAPGPATIPTPQTPGSWRDVELTEHAVRIPFGRALDLGATGKAFAADLVAHTLAHELDTNIMIGVGGDIAVAGPDHHPWQVVVCETPDQTATTLGHLGPTGDHDELVHLPRGGLATSSVVWRRWRHGTTEHHHLIDPRTGAPAHPVWRTASVMAPDAATANAASSASVILGDHAPAWLAEQHLPARLVHADGRIVHLGNWPTPPPPQP